MNRRRMKKNTLGNDYCAATFDELYNVLKKWSELPDGLEEEKDHDKG